MLKNPVNALVFILAAWGLGSVAGSVYNRVHGPQPYNPNPKELSVKPEAYGKVSEGRAEDGSVSTFCSAFVVSDHYALTAAHCVSQDILGMSIPYDKLSFVDSNGNLHDVKPVQPTKGRVDIAALEGDFSGFKHYEVDDQSLGFESGDKLKACGFPWGNPSFLCFPAVAVGSTMAHGVMAYKINGYLAPHMSGGPVLIGNRAVGVNVMIDYDYSFITPILGAGTILDIILE